jgi:hypothetical protein
MNRDNGRVGAEPETVPANEIRANEVSANEKVRELRTIRRERVTLRTGVRAGFLVNPGDNVR